MVACQFSFLLCPGAPAQTQPKARFLLLQGLLSLDLINCRNCIKTSEILSNLPFNRVKKQGSEKTSDLMPHRRLLTRNRATFLTASLGQAALELLIT